MPERRILYLGPHQLASYAWRGGSVRSEGAFESTPEGIAAFNDYLAANAKNVFTLVVNVAEESFQDLLEVDQLRAAVRGDGVRELHRRNGSGRPRRGVREGGIAGRLGGARGPGGVRRPEVGRTTGAERAVGRQRADDHGRVLDAPGVDGRDQVVEGDEAGVHLGLFVLHDEAHPSALILPVIRR